MCIVRRYRNEAENFVVKNCQTTTDIVNNLVESEKMTPVTAFDQDAFQILIQKRRDEFVKEGVLNTDEEVVKVGAVAFGVHPFLPLMHFLTT